MLRKIEMSLMPANSPRLIHNSLFCLILFALLSILAALAMPKPALADSNSPDSEPVLNYCYQGKIKDTRIVVVDKYRQRVLILRYMGEMVVEYEFSCATGSNPGAKVLEGDERTPVGIYFTTHRYKDNKVTIFGDRAIHLNYPSPFDRDENRQGNGIYFHGTNQELKPTSTNGCVVLRNVDMARLANIIKDQRTPVVVVERFRLAEPDERKTACDVLFHLKSNGITHQNPEQNATLALRKNHVPKSFKLGDIPARLSQIENTEKIKTRAMGHALIGLGDRWVFIRDLQLRVGKRQRMEAARRIYLKGDDPLKARLLNHETVVTNYKVANQLAKLSPYPKETQQVMAAAVSDPASKTPKPAAASSSAISVDNKPSVSGAGASAAEIKRIKEKQIKVMLSLWLRDWANKDIAAYGKYYAAEFKGDGLNRKEWLEKKAYLNKVYKQITVKALGKKITIKGKRAKVSFVQLYRSDWHRDKGRKRLELIFRKGRWLITKETWQALE